jgi:hypothetical protein
LIRGKRGYTSTQTPQSRPGIGSSCEPESSSMPRRRRNRRSSSQIGAWLRQGRTHRAQLILRRLVEGRDACGARTPRRSNQGRKRAAATSPAPVDAVRRYSVTTVQDAMGAVPNIRDIFRGGGNDWERLIVVRETIQPLTQHFQSTTVANKRGRGRPRDADREWLAIEIAIMSVLSGLPWRPAAAALSELSFNCADRRVRVGSSGYVSRDQALCRSRQRCDHFRTTRRRQVQADIGLWKTRSVVVVPLSSLIQVVLP